MSAGSSMPTGWIPDPAAVAAYVAERAAAGDPVAFGVAEPALRGQWRRVVERGIYGIFAQDFELAALGKHLPSDFQRRGTCVSRGTYRANQDSMFAAIVRGELGFPNLIAYEPIYGGSRIEVGGGRIRGDGSVGAWAAKWVHDYGLNRREKIGAFDLSASNEDLAVQWGARGVPAEVKAAAAPHKVRTTFCDTLEELADATAATYFSAQCSSWRFGNRDASAMARYEAPTAHCEEVCGVFVLPSWNGDLDQLLAHTGFVRQNSWGTLPSGPTTLRFYQGSRDLRQGSYGVYGADMAKLLRSSNTETWAFGFPSSQLWRPDSLSNFLATKE